MYETAIPSWMGLLAVGVGATFGGALTTRRGAPIVGVLLAGVLLGLGGGIMRDLMLGVTPVAVSSEWFIIVAAACALLGGVLARRMAVDSTALLFLDAWALGMFVVIGAGKAMALGTHPAVGVFLGVVTGIGGGTLVDLLSGEVPTVMSRGPWYASAALLASIYFVVLWPFVPRPVDEWSTVLLLVVVRMLSAKRGWEAPDMDNIRNWNRRKAADTDPSGA